jgi:hypothetical protein
MGLGTPGHSGTGAEECAESVLVAMPQVRRWFEEIQARPATIRAYAQGEPYSNQPAVTEEGRKILFGQTAASVAKG